MMEDALPFNFPVKVRNLPKKGRMVTYEADPQTSEAIARENELISVSEFVATALVSPWQRDGVKIAGNVSAKIIQPCAVSGEPLETGVNEPFEITYVPDGSKLAKPRRHDENEWILDPEGEDVPDTFTGDAIDLAEPWLEVFVLGLDPFARLEDARLPEEAVDETSDSPFAALAQLKPH